MSEKNKNFTVMSNVHLRDKDLSLKAKGLLSVMLLLPDNWAYSIAGLCSICRLIGTERDYEVLKEEVIMANKRMFTMKIVDSDAFLDMPLSTQCLYFHLNMRADDDGFVGNPKRVMKITGASDDDLKLLIAKRFILCFEDGVIVIKHWRMHNTLSQNRYHETQYLDEKSTLKIKKNGSYSFENGDIIDDSKLIGAKEKYDKKERLINGLQTAHSDIDLDKELDIEEDKEREETVLRVSKDTLCRTDVQRILEEWNALERFGIPSVTKLSSSSDRYKMLKARIKQYGVDGVLQAIKKIEESDFLQGKNNRGWSIKFDWFVRPNNFPKVLEGNYDNKQTYDDNSKPFSRGGIDWDNV